MKRLSGYDIEPLRVDIMAAIEHSKLVILHVCICSIYMCTVHSLPVPLCMYNTLCLCCCRLTLECDEDSGLDFHCPASLLLDTDNQV